jgi:hypothetical protein
MTYNLRLGRRTPVCSTRRQSRSRKLCSRLRSPISRLRMSRRRDSSPPAPTLCRAPPCMSRFRRSSCWGIRSRSSCLFRSDTPTASSRGRRGRMQRGGRGPIPETVCSLLLAVLDPRVRRTGDVRAALPIRWPIFGGRLLFRRCCGLLLLGVDEAAPRRKRCARGKRSIRGGTWRLGLVASCG